MAKKGQVGRKEGDRKNEQVGNEEKEVGWKGACRMGRRAGRVRRNANWGQRKGQIGW